MTSSFPNKAATPKIGGDTVEPVSTARKPAKLRTKADYLIIGGGIAGMAALAEARRIGLDAICLEARTKPGGRIRTERNRRMANYPIELGPEFVHGSMMKQLCESLGLTLKKHPSDGAAFVTGQAIGVDGGW